MRQASFGFYTGITYLDAVIAAAVLLYLTVAPGVGYGFVDTYLLGPLDMLTEKKLRYKPGEG